MTPANRPYGTPLSAFGLQAWLDKDGEWQHAVIRPRDTTPVHA